MTPARLFFHIGSDRFSRIVLHAHDGRALPLRSSEVYPCAPPEAEPSRLPFDEGDLVWRPAAVHLLEKHGRFLALNTESATWDIFTDREKGLYQRLSEPAPFGALLHNHYLSRNETACFIARAAASNLVRVENMLPMHRNPSPPAAAPHALEQQAEAQPATAPHANATQASAQPLAAPHAIEPPTSAKQSIAPLSVLSLEKTGRVPEWNEHTIVARAPSLYFSKRGGRTLIVEPSSASWCVLAENQARILSSLESPATAASLHERLSGIPDGTLIETLGALYEHGMITIGGRSFFPPEEVLFAPLDDAPLYPRSFYLHVTDACNFRCSYCYARAGARGKGMAAATAKRIVDRILAEMPGSSAFIEFHGGEALLHRPMIIETTLYGLERAREAGKFIGFSLQTNGSLIDREFARFAARTGMKVGVSLDGPADVHDRNRIFPGGGGTFSTVWNAVTDAEMHGLDCGFIAVAHEPGDWERALDLFVSRGILSFKINYAASIGRGKKLKKIDNTPDAMAQGFLRMVERALEFNRESPVKVRIQDLNWYLRALMTKKREYMCLRSPCGVGRSILAFGTGGEIFPCEEMSTYPEFRCGHIDDETPLPGMIDGSETIRKLRSRTVRRIPKCSVCPWRNMCAGKCLHKSWHAFGDTLREDPMCRFFSTVFESLSWKLDEDPSLRELAGQ
jgi:radical SAM protein with 4Fe4S-binding SPASM domain